MGNKFGGEWTEEKLEALKKYLNFYCNVLKNKIFKKIYIDCFAGSGDITMNDGTTIEGSAKIALDAEPAFNEYYFIEAKKENIKLLKELSLQYPNKKINIFEGDCNLILPQILKSIDWRFTRGLLFIDPYATQFKFNTLKYVSATKAIDVWYLFPFSAVNRMLTKDGDIDEKWKIKLVECLGSDNWEKELYEENPQLTIFGNQEIIKKDPKDVYEYIKNRMMELFPYVCPNYLELKNSNNSTMFLLFLLISSDKPIVHKLVKKVENYILSN